MSSSGSKTSHEQRVQDALAGLLEDDGVELEAVELLADYDLVLVKLRLPDLPTPERLHLQEQVFLDLQAMQEQAVEGASGHVYAPVFS